MPAPDSGRAAQEPSYRWCAPYERTHGPLAVKLARAYGTPPHEWQELVLNDWLALDDEGALLNSLCVLEVPRQNGKTGVSDPRETYGLVVRGEWILHTAQEYQTTRKAFDRLREKFGMRKNDPRARYPELNALVENYTTSANQMVLDLKNGGHIEFRTRGNSDDVARGGTFDLIVVDEAQSYTEDQDAALSPLNSAAPHGSPQTIMMGTVPNPEKPQKGAVFARQRRLLHESPSAGDCIHEWGVGEIGDVHDRARWFAANPSLGKQLLVKALAKDEKSMADATFAREHLGWWPSATGAEPAIKKSDWGACATDEPPTSGGVVAFSVKFSPDGKVGVLAACRRPESGNPYVEIVARRSAQRGTAWFARWLLERADVAAQVTIDGRAKADALEKRLLEGGMPKKAVRKAQTADLIAACSMLGDAVEARQLAHSAQPALDEAVGKCPKRKIGTAGGWGFETAGTCEAELPEAAALAYWGAMTTKRRPGRKARVL